MNIPKLVKSDRKREYNSRTEEEIGQIVYDFLFKGYSHRKLDEVCLFLDYMQSHGYQSMSILHYLGLKNQFKGIFQGYTKSEAISILKNNDKEDFSQLIDILANFNESFNQ